MYYVKRIKCSLPLFIIAKLETANEQEPGKHCKSINDACFGDFCGGRFACYGKKCKARQVNCYGEGCTPGYWSKSHLSFQLSKEILQCCPDCFNQTGKKYKL